MPYKGKSSLPAWLSAVMTHDLKADARERFLRTAAEFGQGNLQSQKPGKTAVTYVR